MKTNKDINILYYINKHYSDIKSYLETINTYDLFVNNIIFQKAIILDLIQIGENINKLSLEVKDKLNKKDLKGVINFRNQLVHGYENNDPTIIWAVLNNNIPAIINDVNLLTTNNYYLFLKSLIGKEIDVIVDRPIRSIHPVHNDIIYNVNYGYTKLVIAPDNEYQDVYVLGVDNPIENYKGEVKAIVHRLNDNEDKLVVGPKDVLYTCEEIKTKINFIEKFFEIEIII